MVKLNEITEQHPTETFLNLMEQNHKYVEKIKELQSTHKVKRQIFQACQKLINK